MPLSRYLQVIGAVGRSPVGRNQTPRAAGLSLAVATALVLLAIYPDVARWSERSDVIGRVQRIDVIPGAIPGRSPIDPASRLTAADFISPTLLVRVERLEGLLASWQTIGGCGAGAGSASSTGLKWVGRNVTGGLFNVQQQTSYTNIGKAPYNEHNLFVNTLINAEIPGRWNLGVLIPFVYKYLDDPFHLAPESPAIDYSNGGLGDMSVFVTRRLGPINATSLTGVIGLPTGTWDDRFPSGRYLNQNAQLGFGKPTGAVVLDHTFDQVWGVVVVGGMASWRGGENPLNSYRAPTGGAYAFTGYFLGPLVPSVGVTVAGFKAHDRDQNVEQLTPLASVTAQAAIEWSTDWIALFLAASRPYKYDGIREDTEGRPRSPYGFMPWTFALGVALSPF